MDWLTQIFETIRNYPWESLGGTVIATITAVGGFKGLPALFDLIFNKTKKTIKKINDNANDKIVGLKEDFTKLTSDLGTQISDLRNDLSILAQSIKELPKDTMSEELRAYINTIKSQSSDIAVKYERELKRLKDNSADFAGNTKEVATDFVEETKKDIEEIVEGTKLKIKKRK